MGDSIAPENDWMSPSPGHNPALSSGASLVGSSGQTLRLRFDGSVPDLERVCVLEKEPASALSARSRVECSLEFLHGGHHFFRDVSLIKEHGTMHSSKSARQLFSVTMPLLVQA